jgi:hypothetical protein
MKSLSAFGCAVVIWASVADAEPQRMVLANNVRPTHYDIAIVADIEKLTFVGNARTSVDVLEPTRTIRLNAAGLRSRHRPALE